MNTAIQKIVADVDPRRDDQPALDRAMALATRCGASIHLHACDYASSLGGGMAVSEPYFEEYRTEHVSHLESWLDGFAERVRAADVEAEATVKWHSHRAAALLELANETGADLLLRSAMKHSRLGRILLGATDWELIRQAPMMLWLAADGTPDWNRLKILAAVDPTHAKDDLADLDRRILGAAERLSREFAGEIHALHAFLPVAPAPVVVPGGEMAPPAAPPPVIDEAMLEEAKASVRKRVIDLAGDIGLPEERVHVLAGEAVDVIDGFVAENGIDIVVAGAVSRSWLERLVIGHTAERLLAALQCDIVVVKPEGFVSS